MFLDKDDKMSNKMSLLTNIYNEQQQKKIATDECTFIFFLSTVVVEAYQSLNYTGTSEMELLERPPGEEN